MVDTALIQNLTSEDLDFLDAETLGSTACVAKLSELAEDSLFDLESGQAQDFYERLNALLLKYSETLENNPETYNQLFVILNSLLWKAMPALPAQVRKDALTHNVVFPLANNVNIRYYLQKYLGTFEFGLGPDTEDRKSMARLLEGNDEVLGNSVILVNNKDKGQPTVKNWLLDYNSYAAFNNIRNVRGHYEQVKYLNTSPNIKTLTKAQQGILFKIIELYDWLLFPGQVRTNIPLVNEQPSRPVLSSSNLTPVFQNEVRAQPSIVPGKNVNIQDILNKRMDSAKTGGVVWDKRPTNVDLGEVQKNVEQKRQETEAEIAKKLEELKKRKGTSV